MNNMKTLNQYMDEQLKNDEFRKEWENSQPELDVIRAIVDARTSQNLTQKELSERTGINQADISKLENGTRNPSLNLLKRLADGMDMMLELNLYQTKLNSNMCILKRSCTEIRHNLLEIRICGKFDGIREKYSDKRISSEALSLIGQMAGSTELIEMGKSMEVTNMCIALERLKAEGVEQGIEQGIEQGMEKGVEKTVISMLKKNYPISEICEITGKTEEEILKIKETL